MPPMDALGRLIESGIAPRTDTMNATRHLERGAGCSRLVRVRPDLAPILATNRPKFDLGLIARFRPEVARCLVDDDHPRRHLDAPGDRPLACLVSLWAESTGAKPLAIPLGWYVEADPGDAAPDPALRLVLPLARVGRSRCRPWAAGVGGLAINYSAYEAEIYRAGLQAIPSRPDGRRARAWGCHGRQAIRRVMSSLRLIRMVIPPVTSDFIALFKDTSVCSVITLTELTKTVFDPVQQPGWELSSLVIATAALYMAMSLPLSKIVEVGRKTLRLASWFAGVRGRTTGDDRESANLVKRVKGEPKSFEGSRFAVAILVRLPRSSVHRGGARRPCCDA